MDQQHLPVKERSFIIISALLALFLGALDALIMSAAMPSIVAELGGLHLYAWVYSVYFLSRALSLPVFGKLADLDQHLTALLADDQKRYIFLPLNGDIFGIELTDDALQVSRPGQQIPFAELTESGWNVRQDTPDVSNR